MTPSRTLRWSALALVAGVALTGCSWSDDSGSDRTESGGFRDAAVPAGEFRLVSFDSCDDLVKRLRTAAQESVELWAGPLGPVVTMDGGGMAPERAAAGNAPAGPAVPFARERAATVDSSTRGRYSGTNTHESGVDEPDLVKTDGRRIVTIAGGTLRVVDAATRAETGAVDLRIQGRAADLLLSGDRALVLVPGGWPGGWGRPMPLPAEPGIAVPDPAPAERPDVAPPAPGPDDIVGPRLLFVDLSGVPAVVGEYAIDGDLVDARQVGTTARVVVRSHPRFDFPALDPAADRAERLASRRASIAGTPLAAWLPRYEVSAAGQASTGQVDCAAVSRPANYTGSSMLTVLTFDLTAATPGDGQPVSVVADGDTVYGTGSSLYIATDQRWAVPMRGDTATGSGPVDDRTVIHRFDTSQPGPPRYAASGEVEGWLINQYAMSEWDGHLRLATTSDQGGRGQGSTSESTVYVLAQEDGQLVETGSVGGLGRGERIYAVRFVGPTGYVVTFRQTDPLYTIDLSDPSAPEVLGELKITGYSAYLHPVGAGRLVGIGQEADSQGRTEGTQISLFDVSDLSDPTRLSAHHIRYGHSEAEFDPHAFLWWEPARTLVIPLSAPESGSAGRARPRSNALVLRIADDQLVEVGGVSHPVPDGAEFTPNIHRSLVVDDTLWTLSDQGLQANDLDTLRRSAWIPFFG